MGFLNHKKYITIQGKGDISCSFKGKLKKQTNLSACDPDREESVQHPVKALKLDSRRISRYYRIQLPNEITKNAGEGAP